jgi:colanic acid/amylovoran biosynthesis glycosyltransferase
VRTSRWSRCVPPPTGASTPTWPAVRAPVHYLDAATPRAKQLWADLQALGSGIRVAELLQAEVRDAAQAIELAALIEARGITHLHAHFGSVATTVARLAARLAGITYSFTAHAKDIFHESVDPDDLRRKLLDAHHVITVSEFNLRYLRERYGRPPRTGSTGSTTASAWTPSPDPALEGRDVDVVAVGRLVEKKGFDVLLEACALARDRGPPLSCRIVGSGERHDALRAQLDALGLQDHVTLVGPLPQDQVRAELRRATVMAAPCVHGADGNADGLPTVILEAMALGTPVVATPVTGIPEAVVDGVTGRLVAERDADALATALLELTADPPSAQRLAAAARRHVEQHFASSRQAAQLRALLPGTAATEAVA